MRRANVIRSLEEGMCFILEAVNLKKFTLSQLRSLHHADQFD